MKKIIPSVFSLLLLLAFAGKSIAQDSEDLMDEGTRITALTKMADSDKYGYTPENPIKVGKDILGGPGNQRVYLSLLRDGKGKKIQYVRLGSCCAYKSDNGFQGYALLDRYELRYKDTNSKKQKSILYLSFYDYEEPLIPVGFQSASKETK